MEGGIGVAIGVCRASAVHRYLDSPQGGVDEVVGEVGDISLPILRGRRLARGDVRVRSGWQGSGEGVIIGLVVEQLKRLLLDLHSSCVRP